MNYLFSIALTGFLGTLILAGCADQPGPRGRLNPQEQVQRLAERLDLNDQQKSEIEQILTEQREKFMRLREEYTGERAEMREVLRDLRAETDEKITAVLNEEQKEEYRIMQSERRERRRRPRDQNN
jgi:hypothetical protein